MSKIFLKSIRRRNPDLLQRVVAFNTDPVSYARPGWLEGLAPGDVLDILLASPRGRRAISRQLALARELGEGVYDFKDPRRRLALVDGQALGRAVHCAGVAANAAAYARLIDRESVGAVRSALGDETHSFALRRASLLVGGAAEEFCDPDPLSDVVAAVRRSGARLLDACFSGESPGLVRRLALRFDPDAVPEFSHEPHPAREAAFQVLRRVLTREVSSQWAALFA